MVTIKSKIDVLRALSKVIAKKAIKFFLIIAGAILALLFVGVCALVYAFSPWWWLLLIMYVPLFIISAIVYLLARVIAHGLYPSSLTHDQTVHLQEFTDKIIRLLETRGMGWWVFAGLCIRDLLLYRELHTLKGLLQDTVSLRQDFTNLENELVTKTSATS